MVSITPHAATVNLERHKKSLKTSLETLFWNQNEYYSSSFPLRFMHQRVKQRKQTRKEKQEYLLLKGESDIESSMRAWGNNRDRQEWMRKRRPTEKKQGDRRQETVSPVDSYPPLKDWRHGWPLFPSLCERCAVSPLVAVSQRWPPPTDPVPSSAGPAVSCCPWEPRHPLTRSVSVPVKKSSTCSLHPPWTETMDFREWQRLFVTSYLKLIQLTCTVYLKASGNILR